MGVIAFHEKAGPANELDPTFGPAHGRLAHSLDQRGECQKAIDTRVRRRIVRGESPEKANRDVAGLRAALASGGRKSKPKTATFQHSGWRHGTHRRSLGGFRSRGTKLAIFSPSKICARIRSHTKRTQQGEVAGAEALVAREILNQRLPAVIRHCALRAGFNL
jgi:hypothetical protein